ncbi:MBL fold metallo-hydrolase [Deinococcus sp. S9]|uniref:ribonuclease Z n=1 Tax=Deinococcus sp. S9 TaxID=2545754 RepID=UPI001056CE1C|nr:MBL fold metallo-hydrolase [Deinococcus sp. S9]TDE86077.1 ribonuclease Z [Deinococcus sp. S9]
MLKVQVLGRPAADNALWVTANSGQGQTRLLLDCGEDTLDGLPLAELQAIDHLLFSHLHMDHVAGFDRFFRANFDRTTRPNHIWGPPGTARILWHRFQGCWWNYAPALHATWHVHDVDGGEVRTFRFEAREAFERMHEEGASPLSGPLLITPEASVEALPLKHHGLSLGYVVREPERVAVDPAQLGALGLKPGPWLAQLKAGARGRLDVHGTPFAAEDLAARLLRRQTGQSVAYLTDFLLDGAEQNRLAPRLAGVDTLYAEAQYAPEEAALAARHQHTTVTQVAALARAAGVRELYLLHLSRRYGQGRWPELLAAAQSLFPHTRFPAGWLDG